MRLILSASLIMTLGGCSASLTGGTDGGTKSADLSAWEHASPSDDVRPPGDGPRAETPPTGDHGPTGTGVPLGTGPGGNLRRMIDFWKMAGIQTHLSDIDSGVSSNNAYRSISKMKTFLSFLNPSGPGNGGPFIFRDDVAFGDAGGDAVNQIGALGYKFVLYLGYGGAVSWNWNNQATRMQAAVDAGHVYAVEGPNEVVNFGLGSYTALDGKTYTGGLAGAHWQMDLYNTYHSQKI